MKKQHKLEERRVQERNAKGWNVEAGKRRVTGRECKRSMEELHGTRTIVEHCQKENVGKTEERYPKKGDQIREYKAKTKKAKRKK